MRQPLYRHIAGTIDAYKRCKTDPNRADWASKHFEALGIMARNCLPSGSGIDCGTKIDIDASTTDKIVLIVEFHHMDDNGMYAGWTSHKVIITASLVSDFDVRITGRDRNGIKDYLSDTYQYTLSEVFDHSWDTATETPVYTRARVDTAVQAEV